MPTRTHLVGEDLDLYIMDMLKVKGPLTARQIMRVSGQPKAEIQPALDSMAERGLIRVDVIPAVETHFPRRGMKRTYFLNHPII